MVGFPGPAGDRLHYSGHTENRLNLHNDALKSMPINVGAEKMVYYSTAEVCGDKRWWGGNPTYGNY